MKDIETLKEVVLGIAFGFLVGWMWHIGDEDWVIGSIAGLLFQWKLEWSRKINQP